MGTSNSAAEGGVAANNAAAMEKARLEKMSQVLENPLAQMSEEDMMKDVDAFVKETGLAEHRDLFRRGALLAANPNGFDKRGDISENEKVILHEETTRKWRQPWSMYYISAISSLAAVVQGMDESVVNGAQLFYYKDFGIQNNVNVQGLCNSAPYLCCFVLSCWLTTPMNHFWGRRGTLFVSCVIGIIASIWEGFTYSWPQLFVARLLLGVAIGPNSSTAPIYTAECAPAPIRGSLVMMWQMWTAFGIMLGFIVSVIFNELSDKSLAWRLMLGSSCIGPVLVCLMVFLGPESPRWYVKKGRYASAFKSMCRLRRSPLQAARDLYYMRAVLSVEQELTKGKNLVVEMVTVPRNRRAMLASGLVMFMQQFCGVNVIAYYSSTIFITSGLGITTALLASLGTGILNWLFAIPAFFTIDTYGRRKLLLITFPLMAICLLITAFSFFAKNPPDAETTGDYNHVRVGLVLFGIYMYEIFYSPGEGPVPFTYSGEAFPLYIRELGMSYATAVCWGFNFVLSISFPKMLQAFTPQGAFSYYAGWCIIGWIAVFFILPETKSLTLEELDAVFSVPTRKHATYQLSVLRYHIRRLLGKKPQPIPPLYALSNNLLEA